ncbi:MAG: GDP-mannose 4,6-dehydratase [Kiritimatiellia bacterium]
MKVLVTGGAGFIGSHLSERLLERGDEVAALDNLNDYYDPALKISNLQKARTSELFTFIEGDILDGDLLENIFDSRKFDVVVHLAARAGVRASLSSPVLYEKVNCGGTLTLMEAVRRHGIRRVVFASSSSVYGGRREVPFSEDARVDNPLSPYAATKVAGELYCRNYHRLYGISVTALRFFTVYGPRQRPDMAISKFTRLIDKGRPVPFFGDGTTERDYTYYTDIIDGVVASIDRDLGFEIINLGESETTTLSEMVKLLEDALGRKAELDFQPAQPGDMRVTCADVSKAGELLSYNPSTSMDEGIGRFVEWYGRHRDDAGR